MPIRRIGKALQPLVLLPVLAGMAALAFWLAERLPPTRPDGGLAYEKVDSSVRYVSTNPQEQRRLELADGTRLQVAGGTRLRLLLPEPGERGAIGIAEGEFIVDVPLGKERLRVVSPAGAVHAEGSRFRLRAFSLRPEPERVVPCLAVETEEGTVHLESERGHLVVAAGVLGLSVGGIDLFLTASGNRQGLLEGFAAVLVERDGEVQVRPGQEGRALGLAAAYAADAGEPDSPETPELRAARELLKRWLGLKNSGG